MRANISIQAKTWLRIEMSARVEPVAIFAGLPPRARRRGWLRASRARRAAAAPPWRRAATGLHRRCRRRADRSPRSPPSPAPSRPERISTTPVPVRRPISIGRSAGLALLHDVGHEALLAGLHRALRARPARPCCVSPARVDLGEEARLEHARVLDPGQHLDLAGAPGRRPRPRGRSRAVKSCGPRARHPERRRSRSAARASDSPSDTLKRRRRRLVSTRVASTPPVLHVLAGVHRLGVDHARRGGPGPRLCAKFCCGDSERGLRHLRPRPRAVRSPAASGSAPPPPRAGSAASSSRRFRSAWARPSSAVAWSSVAFARSSFEAVALGVDPEQHGLRRHHGRPRGSARRSPRLRPRP